MPQAISKNEINEIVKSVMSQLDTKPTDVVVHKMKEIMPDKSSPEPQVVKTKKQTGIFEDITKAIEVSVEVQQALRQLKVADRAALIDAIRLVALDNKETLAKLIVDETGLGNYGDKLQKISLVATKTPGTESLKVEAYSGDDGLTTVEYSPYGVIGAVTPVTNPVETILNNVIGMIASANTVVFNVHPSSIESSKKMISLINEAAFATIGISPVASMVARPTMKTLETLMASPDIRLLVGTGGPGLVKKLLQSGKKAIGAGAGNPPVLVDETADLAVAAKEIIKGASFDNNILCIAEKEVFVVSEVADELIYQMLTQQALLLNEEQVKLLMSFALVRDEKLGAKSCSGKTAETFHVNKEWVGKDVQRFLERLGITNQPQVKLLIFEAEFCHPFVQLEQMMPVLPIVRVETVDEGIALAVKAEKGNRHTALMHSQNITNLTKFARAVESTIFVKNASSLAGVGFEGEGYTTMSIAGPTGEGLTSAKSFSRIRRCTLGQGGFSL